MVIWVFIIAGAILGAILLGAGKPGGRVSYTMGDIFNASIGAAIPGLIIGGVIGVLLSLFAIYDLGFSGLLATLILGVVGAFGLGLLFFVFTAVVKGLSNLIGERGARIITGLLAGAVIGAIFGLFFSPLGVTIMPEYLKFADPLKETVVDGLEELAKFRHCLYADPRCPFFVSWEDPNVQSIVEEFNVKVDFSERRILPDNTINLLVSLSVRNPEFAELHIKPKCFFKKDKERELIVERMGSYAFGDEFVFGTTSPGQELHTTFRCIGEIPEAADKNIYSEYVVVELERPVGVKTIWPVWIGEQPRMGIVRSEMKFNAPYIVALGSNNDMPFEEGKEYDFQLTIKRKEKGAKLKEIETINVKFPEDVLASCDNFEGIDHEFELSDYDYDSLKNIAQYEKEYDKFIFPCGLYVVSAPKEAVMAPFELEAYYRVYSDYSIRIIKSP
ncbi:MAG: hypothetical protein IB618_03710 [Candidatus Pacearchaeota archaeon]|nr:MAG: hypothetical protein IB618_03710 [Candidatus Pacearchaeota archaeon]